MSENDKLMLFEPRQLPISQRSSVVHMVASEHWNSPDLNPLD